MTGWSLRDLNRSTLARQHLLDRATGTAPDVVGQLAGLQAQHATWPYVALSSRRAGAPIADLEDALTGRTVVKATVMRQTLHLVAAQHHAAYDAVAAAQRLATWAPSGRRAGIDLVELNARLRAFCGEPRTVDEMEDHLQGLHPGVDAAAHIPGGVSRAWFRLGTAGGGLVHVPPSGLWSEHGRPRYVDVRAWLPSDVVPDDPPTAEEALPEVVARYLAAYGPASVADVQRWAGIRKITDVRRALAALGDRIEPVTGTDGLELVDLAGTADLTDAPAPARFLAKWDSVLVAYDARDRILPPEHTPAVIRKNGDILPTFLVDGFVAGLWSVSRAGERAGLRLQPFGLVPRADRTALEEEAERIVRVVEPDAAAHEVGWD
ncbi:winged helix DNA-binding domain-containing protein [Oerskovia flava]|uniref:winged helix DNA-binding domain-containing protein n=1 Tax=Oerskovia flava TaxID=2986422 RepID=UPI002240A773|nr:winged helix DNA-binding domain-containing protein [Oerskovia sp. JB1-3-2]